MACERLNWWRAKRESTTGVVGLRKRREVDSGHDMVMMFVRCFGVTVLRCYGAAVQGGLAASAAEQREQGRTTVQQEAKGGSCVALLCPPFYGLRTIDYVSVLPFFSPSLSLSHAHSDSHMGGE